MSGNVRSNWHSNNILVHTGYGLVGKSIRIRRYRKIRNAVLLFAAGCLLFILSHS